MADGLLTPDLCIIGAGAAGLSAAAGAAAFGVETVLIERGEMGGECLNTGCIPSKALVAAARRAKDITTASRFGLDAQLAPVDFGAVMDWVRQPIETIAPQDSVARFERLGVRVIRADAHFIDHETLQAGDVRIRARRFILATGSAPAVPTIPGLAVTPYLTNETIFSLRQPPAHLAILGGGASGVEFAQAFARLGARVTLIERHHILAAEDTEAVAALRKGLLADGVRLLETTSVNSVSSEGGEITLELRTEAGLSSLACSHLLLTAGRQARVEGMGLESAGVRLGEKGILTNPDLRTTNRRIYAIGDVLSTDQFTHAASAEAGRVLQAILFRLPARASALPMPRTVLAEPELVQIGLTEAEAHEQGLLDHVTRSSFAENDAAIAAGLGEGTVKIVLGRRSRLLGVTVVGRDASQLAGFWSLALAQNLRLSAFRSLVLPYPSLSETAKKAALSEAAPLARNPFVRFLVRLLGKLG